MPQHPASESIRVLRIHRSSRGGALIGLAAVAYPFLWSTVAMTAGGELALLIVLIQYLRHRPRAIAPPVDDSATSPPSSAPEAPSQSSSVHPRVHRDGDEA
jgi:hypothetical protein